MNAAASYYYGLLGTTDAGPDILTGLIGHWLCDEGTGTTLVDTSPTANNATVMFGNAPVWTTPGPGSAAAYLSGMTGFLSYNKATYNSAYVVSTGFTVSCKFLPGSLGSNNYWFGFTDGTRVIRFALDSGRQIRCASLTCAGGTFSGVSSGAALGSGVWSRATFTYDASLGLIGYIDASVVLTASNKGNVSAITGTPELDFGGDNNLGGNAVRSGMWDMRYYNRALTAVQVAALP